MECICCATQNPTGATVCQNCGFPLPKGDATNAPLLQGSTLELVEYRYGHKLVLTKDEIIGQEGTIDTAYFSKDDYVSRTHCKLSQRDGNWYVEHVGNCNPTWLNGLKLQHGMNLALYDDDCLKIADLLFKVSIKTLPAQAMPKQENAQIAPCANGFGGAQQAATGTQPFAENPPSARRQWVVVCPVCGKRYLGQNAEFRVSVCTGACKDDAFDKLEIAGVRSHEIVE